MTPKEKAKELIEKFTAIKGNAFFSNECALMAVDELIESTLDGFNYDLYEGEYNKNCKEFWENVKKEIEEVKYENKELKKL